MLLANYSNRGIICFSCAHLLNAVGVCDWISHSGASQAYFGAPYGAPCTLVEERCSTRRYDVHLPLKSLVLGAYIVMSCSFVSR